MIVIVIVVFSFFGVFADEVGRVEEGALLHADVDECRLDSRQHGINLSQVHVANHATVIWTIDEQLDQLLVLQNRHARLTRAGVNEDFSFHRRPLNVRDGDSASRRCWRIFLCVGVH